MEFRALICGGAQPSLLLKIATDSQHFSQQRTLLCSLAQTPAACSTEDTSSFYDWSHHHGPWGREMLWYLPHKELLLRCPGNKAVSPHSKLHTCPWPQSPGYFTHILVLDPHIDLTVLQTANLQLLYMHLHLRCCSHHHTTTMHYSLSWTTEPLSSASTCAPVPSSVAVPRVHIPKAQNYYYWWQISALDPRAALAPWIHMLQISGLSLFHGCPSIRHQCHHYREGTCKPNLAPTEIPLDMTSLMGEKEMKSSQHYSWQLQMPISLACEDPCNLQQCWPKLTELHGDYVTHMAYSGARTETAHPVTGEGLFPPEPACKVWKR